MKTFLFIEPYHSGSHREFIQGLTHRSSHRIHSLTLPGLNWQWRLNGSAVYFAKQSIPFEDYDGIIVSGLIRLCDLKALVKKDFPPVLVYFHETQLTYPQPAKDQRDGGSGMAMADISTALCADRVAFNSRFHRDTFLSSITGFMERVPDCPIKGIEDEIREKSVVLYPGMDFIETEGLPETSKRNVPLVIWNHRWNYDKNAASFFYAVNVLAAKGIEFELAILGECPFHRIPDVFLQAKERLAHRIVHFGYVESRNDYLNWLKQGTVAVSTAKQENFGMAMVEAMRYGCLPLLPNRLSYPEILPEKYHTHFLYSNQREFLEKFQSILTDNILYKDVAAGISKHMDRFSWTESIQEYDRELESLCLLKR